jgi:hypothetical protein
LVSRGFIQTEFDDAAAVVSLSDMELDKNATSKKQPLLSQGGRSVAAHRS